ncbi:cubilin-like [Haliotis rufescens]|uniref:cubilin-like n=1 Tax=Haliotis rufescens TaxID=6454 RepID=UPI001EB083F8|nr:cubilin-like [Haliotis rufescens]XP_046362901.1 cubilin-like [Haliotis rufescens]
MRAGELLMVSAIFSLDHTRKSVGAVEEDRCPAEKYIVATDTPQNLTSPGFPGNYVRPSACKWFIESDIQDGIIKFKVIKFELEGSPSCYRDYLDVRDGPWRLSPRLLGWCGVKPPGKTFKTSGKSATVLFQAVTRGQDKPGFHIQYWQAKNDVLPDAKAKYTVANFILGGIFGVILLVILVTLLFLVIIRNLRYTRERHLQHIRIYS